MKYVTTQRFNRIEAARTYREDPADPIWLQVRITGHHINDIIEESEEAFRIETGHWGFALNPDLYEDGKTYTVHWRHSMSPDNLNVVRQTFVWEALPDRAWLPGHCILYGLLSSCGAPIAGAQIVVEEYRNALTLNHRICQKNILTDAFGYWWVEVPAGSIQRVILGDVIEAVVIPAEACDGHCRVAFRDAPRYQPGADGLTDRWGYPLPGVDTETVRPPTSPPPEVPQEPAENPERPPETFPPDVPGDGGGPRDLGLCGDC